MLAYVLAPHEDAALIKLKALLHPFGLTHFYTDAWGAYLRLLDEQHHTFGIHDIVIGLFINRYEFGQAV
jgi:insertion element IS1 protein InsB